MLYTTIVDKNEEGLHMIIEAATKFDKGKYINAIIERRLRPEQIPGIIEYVKEYNAKLKREHYALSIFALTFNEEWATDNNKCFETAHVLFNKIRCTISGSKKIYKQFCRINRKQVTPNFTTSVFVRSELVNNIYPRQIFGLEGFENCVLELYKELESFFMELINCLALCREMINNERYIRNAPEECKRIYLKCYEDIINNSSSMIRLYKENKTSLRDDIKESLPSENYIYRGFHQFNKAQFFVHVVNTELEKGKNEGLTEPEIKLFGTGCSEKVMNMRVVVEHFDELVEQFAPKGKQKNKLPGNCVASFMLWCGIGVNDKKAKMFVEEYFNKVYTGKCSPIKTGAVNIAKNNIISNKTNNFNDTDFRAEIEIVIAKYTKNVNKVVKLASNF